MNDSGLTKYHAKSQKCCHHQSFYITAFPYHLEDSKEGNFEQVIIQFEVDEGQNADFHLKMQILSQKVLGQPKSFQSICLTYFSSASLNVSVDQVIKHIYS